MVYTARPLVMAGLDPAICRGTVSRIITRRRAAIDGRVKPGHDERTGSAGTSNIRPVGIMNRCLRLYTG